MLNLRKKPLSGIAISIVFSMIPLLILWFSARPLSAQSPVLSDRNCLRDAYGSIVNCTANDFGITDIRFYSLSDPCTGPTDTATVKLLMTAAVGSPERMDIGYFVAVSGTNAIDSGNACYHSVLYPPSVDNNQTYSPTSGFGPFWQASTENPPDICGDSEGKDIPIEFVTLDDITIECKDSNGNGLVDVHVCASYKQANDSNCSDVTGAVPGSPSKCGCSTFDLPFSPSGITIGRTSAEPSNLNLLPLVAGLSVSIPITTFAIAWRKKSKISPEA